MSEPILFALLRTGLAVVVAAGLVSVTLRWSRCRSSRIHRIAWACVLLQGVLWMRIPLEIPILTPAVTATLVMTEEKPQPLFDFETENSPSETVSVSQEVNVTEFRSQDRKSDRKSELRPAVADLVLGIWLTGLAVVVMLRCFGLYRLTRQVKSVKPATEDILCGNRFRILLTEHFGPAIFCNTILVPETLWEESSETVRQGILKHEISHARHRDGLKSLLLSLVAMLHWFNPAAWFALKKFNEAAEWRCDSEAFGTEKNGLAVFAESMLALSRSEPKYLAWVRPYKNRDIKERVRRLKEHQLAAKESTMKKIGILCLVAVPFCFGLVKVQLVAQTPKSENAPAENKQTEAEPATTDGGFATPGGPGVSGFTHLITYGPKGDFSPRTPMDYLSIINPVLWEKKVYMGYFRTKNVDGKLVAMNLTNDPEAYRKVVKSMPQFEHLGTERLTKESFEAYEKTKQESLPPADGGFATGGASGVSGFTHVVTFKPKGDFNPKNPLEFLTPFRTQLVQEGPVTGYFRTKPVDGKLVGSLCTGDPDGLKRFIETVPEIEFVKSERLTKESFGAYNKTKQESLPPADGGFATPNGFTHLVAVGGKGNFVPKTKTQFSREISRVFQGKSIGFGVVRSRVEDGKLILLELTDDPEGFKKVVDASDTLQYLRTERLTKDFYDKYIADYDDSHFLPPADGGFTWHGHRYIVTCRGKGDFKPKTANDFYSEINKYMPWAFAGRPKTKMEGDRLLLTQLTDDAGILKETMDKSPTLEFVSAERLTQEKFDEYQGRPMKSLSPETQKRIGEIENSDWYKKLDKRQQRYVQTDESMFAYVYGSKNYEVGDKRSEFERKWIERLEGPEPGYPGHSQLSVYDEAIIGLATIKSDKAAPLLVKIACERIVKDNAHRHFATKALGMLGDPSVVPELIPLVYHFNWNTRFDAQVALVRLTGQNFGGDEHAWGEWYNANRAKLGRDLAKFDPTPVDWTCGSDDPELKKWADREEQKKMDAR